MDNTILKAAADAASKAVALKYDLDAKEADYKAAKSAYDHYVKYEIPNLLGGFGISSVTLDDGRGISIKSSYKCSPNKNDADNNRMIQWIKSHGGDTIVKEHLEVPASKKDTLLDSNIPFVESGTVNTMTLKAWLTDQLGVNGGTAMLSVEEIPDYIHFYEVKEAVFV